ncbi:regulatory particle non-ATPase [Saccharomyces pastorianus]|uniref:Regulatory particle non-ATPase n=1 Tax=Saccharomyces pastorianus TaxID=27292 RepID=A0A6C1DQR1_SACPS|nr:regulatory particle non-ATPase [Saccharomyces pastorianus]
MLLVNKNKENNTFTWNHSLQHQNESSAASIPPQQTYHFPIFNKYADPTLTTTTSFTTSEATANDRQINNVHLIPNEIKGASETPLQKTVNLKNIMKVSDPYVPTRNTFNYDVKISNDFFDNGDNLYGNDEEVLFYEDNYNPKMQWSLQDNSAAINNEDARAIFNNEFDSDDDDISDDEEDEIEENCLQQEQHQEEPLLSLDVTPISMFGSDQKTGRAKSSSHLFNEYSYVDSNMDSISSVVSEDLLDERGHEKIEDEDEDNDLDEDDIYDISLEEQKKAKFCPQ